MAKVIRTAIFFIILPLTGIAFAGWPIPDSGQSKCYNDTTEITCPAPGEDFYGQDAQYVTIPRSYTKLDASGNDLSDSATSWAMVRDNVTGLIWEVKTDDGSVHDKDNTYTWYDSNPATNGGDAGTPGYGTDTEDFINALNAESFGGYSDWRLPTIKELASVINLGQNNPAIDTGYFLNTQWSVYWSSMTSTVYEGCMAWNINFNNCRDDYYKKSSSRYVRAVRGRQTESFDDLVINGDGTVTDPNTGLMWQQQGADSEMNWREGLGYCEGLYFAGHDDWRLPSREELRSIVDYGTRPAIDTGYFPDTRSSGYWSSATYYEGSAWNVHFSNGADHYGSKSDDFYVRAVRGGQTGSFDNLVISVTPEAEGTVTGTSISCPGDCKGTYYSETTIELTATPADCHELTSWSGDCSGTNSTCTLTMDADKSATANFAIKTFTVTISKAGDGTGSLSESTQTVNCGDSLTITATPDDCSDFDGWTGDATGTGDAVLTDITSDKTLTAEFNLKPFQVTITKAGNGTGNISESTQTVSCGESLTITPTPDANSDFAGWNGDTTGTGSAVLTNITSDKTLTATFSLKTFTVTVITAGNGYGVLSHEMETLDWGTDLTVTATPYSNSTFDGWSGHATGTGDAVLTDITSDKTLTATFTLKDLECLPPAGLDLASEDDTGPDDRDDLTGKTSGLTITGMGEKGATVRLYDNGTKISGLTCIAGSDGIFSANISLTEGSHDITAAQTDTGGNISASSYPPLRIEVDLTPTAPPQVSGDTPTGNPTPTWNWEPGGGDGNGIYRYRLDSGEWVTDRPNADSHTPAAALLPKGQKKAFTLYVQEQDNAGNWSESGTFTIEVNRIPPDAPVVSGITPTSDTTPVWIWESGGGSGIYRYKTDDSNLDIGATETTNTTFTPAAVQSQGSHTLYVQERNDVENWSSVSSFTTEIDSGRPCSRAASLSVADAQNRTFVITYTHGDIYEGEVCGTASSGSGIEKVELWVRLPGSSEYTPADTDTGSSADGTFEFTAETEGAYRFYTLATDNAGNTEDIPPEGYDTETIYASDFAGYAILAVGAIEGEEGLNDHTLTANNVYRHLINRGFALVSDENGKWADPLDNIKYFNPYDDPQTGEDDYTEAGSYWMAMQNAITEWAPAKMSVIPGPLYIILINHGSPDTFYLNETERFKAQEMAGWLDRLETDMAEEGIDQQIIVILGTCYSGSFIDDLSKPGRIIVTSTSDDKPSYRGPGDPGGTRDGEFLVTALFNGLGKGLNLLESFGNAVIQTEAHTDSGRDEKSPPYYDTAVQHPHLDDNGDGIGSNDITEAGADGDIAAGIVLGWGDEAAEAPLTVTEVGKIPAEPLPPGTEEALLWAKVSDSDRVESLWVEIREPGMILEAGEGQQTVELTSRPLTRNDDTGRYEVTYYDFTVTGKYRIFFYVKDENGLISPFARTVLYKSPDSPLEGDVSGDDAVTLADAILALRIVCDEGIGGEDISVQGDVNGDEQVGLAEVIYILREVAK